MRGLLKTCTGLVNVVLMAAFVTFGLTGCVPSEGDGDKIESITVSPAVQSLPLGQVSCTIR